MKRTLTYATILLSVLLAACAKVGEVIPSPADDGLSLVFTVDDQPVSKAGISGTRLGEDAWNENKINVVHLFLYPQGQTESNAVIYRRISPDKRVYTSGSFSTLVSVSSGELEQLFPTATTCHALAIANVPDNWISTLADHKVSTIMSKSLPETRFGSQKDSTHLRNSFVFDGYNTLTLKSKNQTKAVIGTIPLYRAAAKFSLLLNVPDTIHVMVDYVDNADGNKKKRAAQIWRPAVYRYEGTIPQVEAYLQYGMSQAKAGVRYNPDAYIVNGDEAPEADFFDYNKNRMSYWQHVAGKDSDTDQEGGNIITEDGLKWMISDPSYSYPQTWTEGLVTEPFYKLVMPWSLDEKMEVFTWDEDNHSLSFEKEVGISPTFKQLYYKIVFPMVDDATHKGQILSNNWYRLKLKVGVLGSETDDFAVDISPTYMVADWQNLGEVSQKTEVGNARYLSVAQYAYTMYNTTLLDIPYTTSDKCMIVNATWKKPYYGPNAVNQNDPSGYRITSDDEYGKITSGTIYNAQGVKQTGTDAWTFDISDGKTIKFTHTLNNAQTNTRDLAPYIIQFTIRHIDDPSFSKTVTIIQYPSLYMEYVDGDNVFVDGYFAHVRNAVNPNRHAVPNMQGYYYSDNYTGTTSYNNVSNGVKAPYGSVHYDAASHYSLLNITKISISAFTSADNKFTDHTGQQVEYIIGDPRVPSGWTNADLAPYLGNDNVATQWDDKAGQIMIGTTDRTNVIAPAILFSSAWNTLRSGSQARPFEESRKRCATYQEGGYPAGRWRLPTEAEVAFVRSLQTDNLIPSLFDGNSYYWCSDGWGRNNNGWQQSTGNNTGAVRCVYDVWYWGEDSNKSVSSYWPLPTAE